MDKVKKLLEAGLSPAEAIKQALGMPVTGFADRYGLPRGTTSEVINSIRRPTDEQVRALIAELGGSEYEWRLLLWEAGRPAEEAALARPA